MSLVSDSVTVRDIAVRLRYLLNPSCPVCTLDGKWVINRKQKRYHQRNNGFTIRVYSSKYTYLFHGFANFSFYVTISLFITVRVILLTVRFVSLGTHGVPFKVLSLFKSNAIRCMISMLDLIMNRYIQTLSD